MGRCERREPPPALLELPRAPGEIPAAVLVPGDDRVDKPLEEVALVRSGGAPRILERLVGLEVAAVARQRQTVEKPLFEHRRQCYPRAVATILLCGVDLFFRGKLDALLADHRLVTTDSVDPPDVVIADIARIDPVEVADTYPDVPIIGFTNHNDTGGLRAAHAAGFDQVLAKSALVERVDAIVTELVGDPR